MKIIIAGAGKVGSSIAESLSREGHDITVIDRDGETITRLSNALDVICMEGSATNPENLREAGAAEADLLIAATQHDEVNMVCGISARKLGTRNIVARIRDPQYLSQTEFLRETLGLSVVVNPEYECAKEISRMLRFPSAVRVDAFSKGSVEMVEHRVSENGRLNGMQLKDLSRMFGARVLVGLVEREGKAIIPDGMFTLRAGDRLRITGSARELRKFFIATRQYRKPVRKVLIMGGGRTSVYLATILSDCGMEVSLLEKNRARCEELCNLLPSAHIICGDGTHSDVLAEEGIRSTDAFVGLTGEDGDNIISSVYAKYCGVATVITKLNREHFPGIIESAGLDSVVSPKEIVAQQLTRYARAMHNSIGGSMESLYRLAEGQVEAMEFKVNPGAACTGVALKDLHLKKNILISSLVRGDRGIIPDGGTVIEEGDHVVIMAPAGRIKSLNEIVEA